MAVFHIINHSGQLCSCNYVLLVNIFFKVFDFLQFVYVSNDLFDESNFADEDLLEIRNKFSNISRTFLLYFLIHSTFLFATKGLPTLSCFFFIQHDVSKM